MKTNAKKRMLISSVAMLLIAMIALGTATFAWFTSSTTPYADRFSATTTKQSTLLLSAKDRTTWQTHLEYCVSNRTMFPASGNGTNWVKGNSNEPLTGAIDSTSLKAVLPTPDAEIKGKIADYVYVNELNIKNNGTADVTNIKISFTLKHDTNNTKTAASYARVALVPIDGNTVGGDDLTAITTGNVYALNNTPYKPIINTDGDEGASITPSTTFLVDVTAVNEVLKPDAIKYYKLFVWFEGQDENCVDAMSGQAIPDLRFDISSDIVKE